MLLQSRPAKIRWSRIARSIASPARGKLAGCTIIRIARLAIAAWVVVRQKRPGAAEFGRVGDDLAHGDGNRDGLAPSYCSTWIQRALSSM